MHTFNAIEAATRADPYPYYATLLAGAPLQYDVRLGLWLAAQAQVVGALLCHPDCHVRPAAQVVPATLAGGSAGQIFGQLLRMNEGDKHTRPKLALGRALAGVDLAAARACARDIAADLAGAGDLPLADALSAWIFKVPLYAMASLLGFPRRQWAPLAAWMADFVACFSPLSDDAHIARANEAALALLQSFRDLLAQAPPAPGSLLAGVMDEAAALAWDDGRAILANLVGLLSQTYEASAGLIGNSVTALLSRPGLAETVHGAPQRAMELVREVSRFDPPVQNTRRFVARSTVVAGVELAQGQAILLLLGAASRDPAANIRPDEFLLERQDRRVFGFGHGPHACPGHALACAMAAGAIDALPPHWLPPGRLQWSYRPSVNARIPVFFYPQELA
ncbi:cytochrome P450 [Oxalobacteraceae bacterium GrIS 1.11]